MEYQALLTYDMQYSWYCIDRWWYCGFGMGLHCSRHWFLYGLYECCGDGLNVSDRVNECVVFFITNQLPGHLLLVCTVASSKISYS